ncbi:helix-turn-helix domain-containing protein [Mycobacterium sp. NPDC006124]|uniref:helix-turn-helix domain-containing protein n=1 Tax=Mycobacterium sp. NPDC006124 TaxID=3156729 RepID=UPI0033B7E01F
MSRLSTPTHHSSTAPQRVDSTAALISTAEAAKRLGVSPTSLRGYVATGLISCRRVGPKLLKFDPREVEQFARRVDNR